MSAFIVTHSVNLSFGTIRRHYQSFHPARTRLRSSGSTFVRSDPFQMQVLKNLFSFLFGSTPESTECEAATESQRREVQTEARNEHAPIEVQSQDVQQSRQSKSPNKRSSSRGDTLLLVGLGNPGPKFEQTPHNIGFELVTEFAKRNSGDSFRSLKPVQGEVCTVVVDNAIKVHILKPMTYMNISGTSVKSALRHFNLQKEALLVVADDISMELGRCRIRPKGSAGGHNGLKSIEKSLGSQDYARLKVGVGIPTDASVWADFVLQKFSPSDRKAVEQITWNVMDVLDLWTRESDISVVSNKLGLLQNTSKKG